MLSPSFVVLSGFQADRLTPPEKVPGGGAGLEAMNSLYVGLELLAAPGRKKTTGSLFTFYCSAQLL